MLVARFNVYSSRRQEPLATNFAAAVYLQWNMIDCSPIGIQLENLYQRAFIRPGRAQIQLVVGHEWH